MHPSAAARRRLRPLCGSASMNDTAPSEAEAKKTMLDALLSMPLWAVKLVALLLGLGLAGLAGLGLARLYRRLTDRPPVE